MCTFFILDSDRKVLTLNQRNQQSVNNATPLSGGQLALALALPWPTAGRAASQMSQEICQNVQIESAAERVQKILYMGLFERRREVYIESNHTYVHVCVL